MTTPQKVTKKRLVAYIDPDVYDFLEHYSLSNDLSLSKSAEKLIIESIKKKPEGSVQLQNSNNTIDSTICEFLYHLPEDIIEKISEQIMTSPLYHDHIQRIHAGLYRAGTDSHDDNESEIYSNNHLEKKCPEGHVVDDLKKEMLISIHAGTDRHSSNDMISTMSTEDGVNESIHQASICHQETGAIDLNETFSLNISDLNPIDVIDEECHPSSEQKENEISQKTSPFSYLQERIELYNESIPIETQSQKVALLLKQYLDDTKITQRAFKKLNGIDITQIKSWIIGKRSISDKMAQRILHIIIQTNID